MTDHEKRASERVPVALRIRLRYQAVDQFISKFAVNISRGGMFLSSRNPKAPGTRIYFEILLADESPVIEGDGEVRWVREYDRRRPDQPYGMGIEFVTLSETSWPLLERIIVHRRATGVFDDDGIPEPRGLPLRGGPRAPVDREPGHHERGTAHEDDLASRLGTVVEGERDDQAHAPDGDFSAGGAAGGVDVDGALDTAEHRMDLGEAAVLADHAAVLADHAAVLADHAAHRADADLAADRASGGQGNHQDDRDGPFWNPPDAPATGSRQSPDVIASVARPADAAVPTNGAHAERGDDSPDDRLRRELMRALGPSVLMSQVEAAPVREPERAPERAPEREPERAPERSLTQQPAREPERAPERRWTEAPVPEPERAPERRWTEAPVPVPERAPERAPGRSRTGPPTEPVVRAAMRRARALTSGGVHELDRELAELLEHSAVPVEISVEAASRELAERLGGAPVQRRYPLSGPVAAASPPPPVDGAASSEAASDDEPPPTSARRTRASADLDPSAGDSHAARLLRGK